MNVEENILESILEDNNVDDFDEDVEMIDIEEGELVEEHDSVNVSEQTSVTAEGDHKKSESKNRKRRANKKKNRRKRNGSGPNVAINIDRFVLDTCRRLKEKKSYMVYTAVGCLGLSALSDIIKEVDAIQACGGQKTADDKRFRTGGGVLWNIIKVREPQAFKEIMKKAKEFEKQFRHPNVKQPPMQKKEDDSPGVPFTFVDGNKGNVSDNSFPESQKQDQSELSCSEEKRVSVHDRLRTPVSYDDDLLELSADNNAK
ncbi:unnamed protein product [Lupinus luteus]|uniref:Phosphorylated adapter RNA export protein n=1 Tax=Lupinus luteus TaxID=3873 RepID=A0AAV1YHA9_LUPLU